MRYLTLFVFLLFLTTCAPETIPAGNAAACICNLRSDTSDVNTHELYFVFNWREGSGIFGIGGEEMLVALKSANREESDPANKYYHENERNAIYTTLKLEGPADGGGEKVSGTIRAQNRLIGSVAYAQVSGTCKR